MTEFSTHHQQRLKDLSKVREDMNYPVQPNIALEEYITMLKDLYPQKFHTAQTLRDRVFMDAPTNMGMPYTRFVREKEASPYLTRTH